MERVLEVFHAIRNKIVPQKSEEVPLNLWGSLGLSAFFIIFILFKYLNHELQPIHVVVPAILMAFYFCHAQTRLLLILSIPIVMHIFFYDLFRYIPFEWLRPIHVVEPYQLDKLLFGINDHGKIVMFNEYLLHFSNRVFDVISGVMYHIHMPAVFMMFILFWRLKSVDLAERFAAAFLLINIFAYLTYFFYPVAAPWYVEKYGFIQPLGPVMGSAAGLVKFDSLLGKNISSDLYNINPVVFGAIPSMHAGFSMLCLIYSFYVSKKFAAFFGIYAVVMWFSALYLQHHYMIDLVIGIFYAFVAWFCIEKLFLPYVRKIYQFFFRSLIKEGYTPQA